MSTPSFNQLFPSEQFENILLISDQATDVQPPDGTQTYSLVDALNNQPPEGQWDLILIRIRELTPDTPGIQQLISRCRDIHSRRLVILLNQAPDSTTRQYLMSLGLHQLPDNGSVFYHDLYDYKPTPDWLNNRFWANPDLWNKYRW
jgi:hypothetical protein